jgi:hypothetical protein
MQWFLRFNCKDCAAQMAQKNDHESSLGNHLEGDGLIIRQLFQNLLGDTEECHELPQ